jgi:hypothetical protein
MSSLLVHNTLFNGHHYKWLFFLKMFHSKALITPHFLQWL